MCVKWHSLVKIKLKQFIIGTRGAKLILLIQIDSSNIIFNPFTYIFVHIAIHKTLIAESITNSFAYGYSMGRRFLRNRVPFNYTVQGISHSRGKCLFLFYDKITDLFIFVVLCHTHKSCKISLRSFCFGMGNVCIDIHGCLDVLVT